MTIKFAIVGCGKIANRHAGLLGESLIQGAKLSAVCDLDRNKAIQLGDKFGVPYFSDVREMLQNIDIDCVSVLTGSGYHAEVAALAAEFKKHVIVEKPMAMTVADADQMIDDCERAGVMLFVVKQNRFNVPIQKLRKALDGGRLGKLVLGTVRVRWARHQDYYDQADWRGTKNFDGGVLMNQASHHIDLLSWLMGDVKCVQAMTSTALVDIEVENTAVAILQFSSGALGVVETTTATRPNDLEGSISILGEGGSVVVGGFAANELDVWSFVAPVDSDSMVFEESGKNPDHPYGYAHAQFYKSVVSSLSNDHSPSVSGRDGRVSLRVIEAIYESAESGRKVYL